MKLSRVFHFSKDSFFTKHLPILLEDGYVVMFVSNFFESSIFDHIFEKADGLSRLKISQNISIKNKPKCCKYENNNSRKKKCYFALSGHYFISMIYPTHFTVLMVSLPTFLRRYAICTLIVSDTSVNKDP